MPARLGVRGLRGLLLRRLLGLGLRLALLSLGLLLLRLALGLLALLLGLHRGGQLRLLQVMELLRAKLHRLPGLVALLHLLVLSDLLLLLQGDLLGYHGLGLRVAGMLEMG